MNMIDIARSLAGSGVSVIPIRNGSKAAAVEWKPFQERIAADDELVRFFADGSSIAAVCGPISGGLELMDFDIPGKGAGKGIPPAWKPFRDLLVEHGHEDLLRRLILVETPSGGRHIVYRCPGVVANNQKLAMSAENAVLIETRGNGGYFLIPPTDGYTLRAGSFDAIPSISEAEREILHTCARCLNEHYEQPVKWERNHPGCERPGDQFNLRGPSIDELLIKHGWTPVKSRGGWRNFTRPDKPGGISGGVSESTGFFHCFSTSTRFEIGKGYSKFSVYALLEHNGDFFHAAQALKAEGYGGVAPTAPRHEGPTYATTVPLTEEDEAALWGTLDEFDDEEINWFWQNRIPVGAITMFQGDPGIGKSTITMAIAAAASMGGVLPEAERIHPCHVVLVATEDDPSKVIKPRLRDMGADLKQISVLGTDRKKADGTPIFEGVVTVEMIFNRIAAKNAKLLIIDPLIESLAALGIDVNKSEQVRPFMARLRNMADANDCAVVIVHHNNKNSGGKALYRAVGSIDIPASCRSVFSVGSDPENPGHKVMAHVKSNWAAMQPSLAYSIDNGVFGWLGESQLTAEDISQPPAPKAEREKSTGCREWLKSQLSEGPVNSEIIHGLAGECGYSRRKVFAAKDELGVAARRKGGAGEKGYWVWCLPGQDEEGNYDPHTDR